MELPEELVNRPPRKEGVAPTATLTLDAYTRLKAELEQLKDEGRSTIAEKLRIAREHGDLRENAEYDSAKNDQAHLEARIATLEERLKNARVVTRKEIRSGEVNVGTKVRLKDMGSNKTVEYHIVGSAEADPAELKLSNESPVGKAIMGHKKGDVVEAPTPRGAKKFKIMDVQAA